jgi:alginate O-acetyltransferase complex protein AlgJ
MIRTHRQEENMKASKLIPGLAGLLLAGAAAHAAETSVVIGKNEWLFTRYEWALTSDAKDTENSIQLLQKANKLFEKRGIALAVAIVPSKIRIHSDQLPDNKPIDGYTDGKYDHVYKALTDGGVNVVNLNKAFLASPHRSSDTPLFLKRDTHWSPAGALLAAETIKATIDATPALKKALDATPEVKYTFAWNNRKIPTRARDLVLILGKEAPEYPVEQVLPYKVARAAASQASLTGAGDKVGITVIGSSYTNKNTLYPDGLRYTLQRDLLDISLPVDQGPWYGMQDYLKNEAFKTNPPKLIIWEIPEREMRSPPDNKYRDARYQIPNDEWLNRMTNLLK